MTSARDLILNTIFPVLGSIISVLMFLSSMKSVLVVRKLNYLGELNPLPFAATVASGIARVAYAYVIVNWYVLVPNYIGLILGLFYLMITANLCSPRMRDLLTLSVVSIVALVGTVGAVGSFAHLSYEPLRLLWGYTSLVLIMAYYAAPLSTVADVFRMRSCVSLHFWLVVMNFISGAIWTAYGIAINDPFVWGPNAGGTALSAFCVILCFVFPRTLPPSDRPSSEVSLEPEGALRSEMDMDRPSLRSEVEMARASEIVNRAAFAPSSASMTSMVV